MSDTRYRLILGKFQVTGIEKGLTGFRAKISFGSGVTLWIDCPIAADVRVGDMLTFYTEVLANEHESARPN
jgi:flavin reductase (DIM6/NTAB) family NADH-FMN oxidoreductase RutF